jgi:hypothetical protein
VTTPGPKPAVGGTINVIVIGDSIGDGIGDDTTGDGSDGLHYGGAALPGWLILIDEGVTLANWPDGDGTTPGPGILPHLAEALLDLGYTTVRIIRDATSSAPTTTVRTDFWPQAVTAAVAAGLDVDDIHLVVPVTGTNDSQTGESATFTSSTCPKLIADIEGACRNARIVWVEPGAPDGAGFEEADDVRTAIRSNVANKSSRRSVDTTAAPRTDTSHPSLAGYAVIGPAVVVQYQAAT